MKNQKETFSSCGKLQREAGIESMVKNAIHKKIITQPEYEKIVGLSDQDLTIGTSEKRLLDHLQGLMGNR
ncbi:MAG: hypothetical protein R6V54_04275 [Desulfobacteraceae bacterium]